MTSDKVRSVQVAAPALVIAFLFASCANHHFHVVAEGPTTEAPRYVELLAETRVATLHFPSGTYSFYATDEVGCYYRAPRKIVQHTAAGSTLRSGGIFVDKRNARKLRGYIFLAGALTHIGDLSRAPHDFRD